MNYMKYLIIITLFLVSCGISNEEIIEQTKLCEENNMKPKIVMNLLTRSVIRVICMPLENIKDKK